MLRAGRETRLYSRSRVRSELTVCDREVTDQGAAASTAFTMRLSEMGYAVPSAWAK